MVRAPLCTHRGHGQAQGVPAPAEYTPRSCGHHHMSPARTHTRHCLGSQSHRHRVAAVRDGIGRGRELQGKESKLAPKGGFKGCC